jgi:hypothetical protein
MNHHARSPHRNAWESARDFEIAFERRCTRVMTGTGAGRAPVKRAA